MPNLFIVGAPKAGTSFLYHKLKSHPELFFPKVKELNHFSQQEIDALDSYYKDYKIRDRKKYLNFCKPPYETKYAVDASVSYFAFEEVPYKIHAFNPEAKILIVIRNPIKRAHSHFLMDERMGYAKETLSSYIGDKAKNSPHFHQYINNSLYYKNIKNYQKVFGKEAVKIMLLEEIDQELPELFKFLNIADHFDEIDTSERVNENKKPKNILSKMLQNNRNLTSKLKLIIPERIVKKYNGLLYEKAEKQVLSTSDYQMLQEILIGDVEKLETLLGRDLKSVWNINRS